MSLLDITPSPMRDPFAPGALLPETITTRNSRYDIREHALHIGLAGAVTVTCVVGTFAGESWTVDRDRVRLTRNGLVVASHIHTSSVTSVNGYPVSAWKE